MSVTIRFQAENGFVLETWADREQVPQEGEYVSLTDSSQPWAVNRVLWVDRAVVTLFMVRPNYSFEDGPA